MPTLLDPPFKALLIEIADRVERQLGLADTPLTIVTLRAHQREGSPTYDFGLACERAPELLAAIRNAFPRRLAGGARIRVERLGGLRFEGVGQEHLQAVLARLDAAARSHGL